VEAQIVEKWDALDGVKDGLIEDPRACKVDVGALTGVTAPQRALLAAIYGVTNNKDGVSVRLREVRPLDLQDGHDAGVHVSQRDRSEPRRFQGARREAAAVARLVGSGPHRARQHQVSRPGAGARPERARVLRHVHDARRAPLRRRSRSRHDGLAAAIDEWVEKGKAPERIVAQKRAGAGAAATVARTRPLCAYPQRAVHSGTGSEAASFVCRQP
jgi:hypothetical protein